MEEMHGTIVVLSAIPYHHQNPALLQSEVASLIIYLCGCSDNLYTLVAGQPTRPKTVISGSNTTHVNVCVSWESPGGDVSGYMIYYQTEGGPVISDKVSGGGRETHSLDGLQRGVTYYISILALSQHLPSPLVGAVSVNTGKLHTSLVAPFLYSLLL